MKNIKLLLLLPAIALMIISADKCNSKKTGNGVYKAKLETKGICMNYTLRLVEGSLDSSMITPNWTDESTNKSFTNVFGLANPCNFPATIEQGDEFYFQIDSSGKKDCAVCMAYYPTPPKKLYIKVVEK